MVERRPRFIEPRFERLERFHHSQVRDQRSIFDTTPADTRSDLLSLWQKVSDADISRIRFTPPETSTNWCGGYVKRRIIEVVLNRPQVESYRVVAGRWTVPSVSLPAAAYSGGKPVDGTYIAATWVGIDGTQGTGDVLQAGTLSNITVSGGKVTGTSYQAWTEWFTVPWIVQGLAVSAGDLISCIVCAPFENTHGTAIINNLTTNESAMYGIDPPPGVKLAGNVAEWIVEDPATITNQPFPFPNFGQVVFTHCSANTQNTEVDLSNAHFIDLIDSAGNTRAQSYYQTTSSLRCQFLK